MQSFAQSPTVGDQIESRGVGHPPESRRRQVAVCCAGPLIRLCVIALLAVPTCRRDIPETDGEESGGDATATQSGHDSPDVPERSREAEGGLVAMKQPRDGVDDEHAPWFEEVADRSGIDFVHRSGHADRYLFPEIMAGGVGLLDYDNDGHLDIYFVQGGQLDSPTTSTQGNRLYRNRGDATFEDVTERAGVGDVGYGMGCACGDYDADGDVDIYVTNFGPNKLYRNNGDGTFTDVSREAGVDDSSWSSSALFMDYDGDGRLDLFVVNYIRWSPGREQDCFSRGGLKDYCHPSVYHAPASDTLYRNRGDGSFDNVSLRCGIDRAFGTGLGVASGDFDGDGRIDLYVANDGMPNQLWINAADGRFTDESLFAGCAVNQHGVAEAGMGVTSIDVDDDGDLDLFLSHLRAETNTLYVNDAGMFDDATAAFGLAGASLARTGFGLGFADFDLDGALDLYVANGRVMLADPRLDPDDPYAEPNLLFSRRSGGRFKEILPCGGTTPVLTATSRGAALGDIDNDGDIDIVVVNKDAPAYLLRNVAADRARTRDGGRRNNWIMLRLVDVHGSDAIGARVRVDAGDRSWWRSVQPGYGYCSSHDPRVHVGLGQRGAVDMVWVRWPDGTEKTYGPFAANKQYLLLQAAATAPSRGL